MSRCFFISVGITFIACCIAIFFDQVVILFAICGFINVMLMVVVPSNFYSVFMKPSWTRLMKFLAFFYAAGVVSLASFGLFNSLTGDLK
jgi:hypothetical protein